jgi:outer membrane protein
VLNFLPDKDIVYVDNAMLLANADIALQAQEELNNRIEEFQAEIAKKEQEIQVLRNLYEKSGDKATIEQELNARISDYEQYMEAVQESLTQIQAETLNPVFDNINKAIADYGKKRNYYMILGATSSGNLVFGNKKADITEDVIRFINSDASADN